MAFLPILAVSFVMHVVSVLFAVCAVFLVLLVLIQKGRGGGLSAALGGGMASNILGSKTGDFLTWLTIVGVALFLTLGVLMAKFYVPTVSEFGEGPGGAAQKSGQQGQVSPSQPSPEETGDSSSDVDAVEDTNASDEG